MKTKGIPIWEQYLEYIVLGIAAMALVGFTAMQFVGSPNAVEAAGVGKVSPGNIDQVLEQNAQEINNNIQGTSVTLDPPKPVLATFEERVRASVSPRPALQHAFAPRISPVPKDVLPVGDRLFVVATVPAPVNVLTQQYFDTLPEEVVSEFPDLRTVLPPNNPYDISWITTAASFNAQEVLRQFGSEGPNGEAPLPPRWYDNSVFFVDVRLEREELSGGQWGNAMLLEPIPGQLTFREFLAGRIDASTRDQVLTEVSTPAGRNALIRPEFYTGAAAAWAPPREHELVTNAVTEEELAILDLKSKLARDRTEFERSNKRFSELNCPPEEPGKPDPSPPKSGASGQRTPPPVVGGNESASAGGGGRQIGGGTGPVQPTYERECRGLRNKLRKLKEKIQRVEAELAKLQADAPQAQPEEEPERLDNLQIWAHDITIQPGKTYRYRMIVDVYNPLFLRGNELQPPQKHMAEKFTLASAASEWSAPITADPPIRLFVTNARPAGSALGQLPAGTASAEVYRFRDGKWWGEPFTVQPGMRIGGVKGKDNAMIDYGTDWFVLDVVPDIAADQEQIAQGLGAAVVLQSLTEDGLTEVRLPQQDAADPERAYLRQESKAAKAAEAVAIKK